MTNLKGKDLDDFFRNELSNGQIPFDETNWLRLEKRLKRNNRKHTITWITVSGIAAMLLLTLSVTYLFNNGTNDQPRLSRVKKHTEATTPLQGPPALKDAGSKSLSTNTEEVENTLAGVTIPNQFSTEKIVKNHRNSSPAVAVEKATESPRGNVSEQIFSQSITKTTDTALAGTSAPASSSETINQANTIAGNISTRPNNAEKDSSYVSFEPLLASRSRFSLSLLAGPDINGVNNLRNNRGGISVGLMAGYKLSRSLSITTGAVYAKKLYNSEFEYYNPKSSYKFPVTPKLVNADCRVLDIPVNINYVAWSKTKNAIIFSGGISSYLMLNEQYSFTYDNPASRGPRTYYITNRNKHYLGILNFAAGYQRKVTDEVSIGVQPYFKLPVTDIGYGNVKLLSTGIVTSVQFNLPSKTK